MNSDSETALQWMKLWNPYNEWNYETLNEQYTYVLNQEY